MLPLSDVRILAFTHYAAGPFGMMQLADLGAEVINIEDPETGGDLGRYTPPFHDGGEDSLFYQSFNRNKKSVAISLRKPEGRDLFHRLVARADAIYNNLRGDQPAKLGLTYAALSQFNPRIVCCSASGFGSSGPRMSEPCFDYLIQAYLGIMDLTGDPAGPPERAGISFVDFSTGLMSALAVMVGLWHARTTGRGGDVETSMLATGLSYLNYVASYWLNEGLMLRRLADSAHPTVAPSQRFRTKDGYVMVMAQTEKFWQVLCKRLGREDLIAHPRYRTLADRSRHADELRPLFAAIFAERTTAEWLQLLRGHVPCAPIHTLAEGLADPQVEALEILVEIPHPSRGTLKAIGSPIQVKGGERPSYRCAPRLGQHTREVLLQWLGLPEAELERLESVGVIR